MAVDIVMPHMGESVVEGTILKWLKKPGDRVEQDEPLVEVGTDKINVEIPSPATGVLQEILAKEGVTVTIDQKIAVVETSANEVSPAAQPVSPPALAGAEKQAPRKRGGETRSAVPPAPRKAASVAARPAVSLAGAQRPAPPTRPRVRIAPTQGPVALGTLGVLASPSVRRLAREHLVDLGKVKGTGRMGRILREDVLAYLNKARTKAATPADGAARPAESLTPGDEAVRESPGQPDVDEELVPLSPMRRAVAEHMARSKHVAPHVTTVAEVDMTRVAALREKWKAEYAEKGAKLTYTVFIASAVVRALREYPALNSSWTDDGLLVKYRIHLGLAVSVEEGLVVPVIRDADRLDLADLAKAIGSIAEKTRAGKVAPSDLGGGTFTITNPGVYGAVLSTPIIHQPQAAILATGRIADVAAVVNGGLAVRKQMYLSLSYDHRVVDGATAVQFLQRVRQILEKGDF